MRRKPSGKDVAEGEADLVLRLGVEASVFAIPDVVFPCELDSCRRDIDAEDGELGYMCREQCVKKERDAAGAGAEI